MVTSFTPESRAVATATARSARKKYQLTQAMAASPPARTIQSACDIVYTPHGYEWYHTPSPYVNDRRPPLGGRSDDPIDARAEWVARPPIDPGATRREHADCDGVLRPPSRPPRTPSSR